MTRICRSESRWSSACGRWGKLHAGAAGALVLIALVSAAQGQPSTCPGDCDGNGIVNIADLPPFVAALLADPPNLCADANGNGAVNGLDIQPFVGLVLANGGQGTPCPNCVPPGDDCWKTTACGPTLYDFSATPLPADFFGPGSDPFFGEVQLFGAGLGPFGSDTTVRRLGQLCFPQPLPSSATVPIELVALSLVSCQPITVTYNGGQNPEQWDVSVGLSAAIPPPPPGLMTASKTHANGGTFDSNFFVQPRFTFTHVGMPGHQVVLDTGQAGIPPMLMTSSGGIDWLITSPYPTCSLGFAPGVREVPLGPPCCPRECHEGPSPNHKHCVRPPQCFYPCREACCLPGGLCSDEIPEICEINLGIPKGPDTSCATTVCP